MSYASESFLTVIETQDQTSEERTNEEKPQQPRRSLKTGGCARWHGCPWVRLCWL
jgi:hypothetical protein